MTDAFTVMQIFALIGLVLLIGTLVLGEMFERAIERHLDEHGSYDAAQRREKEERR
jgi:hypothetical protein